MMTKPQELTSREWVLLEQSLRIVHEGGAIKDHIALHEFEILIDKIYAHRRALVNSQ